MDEDYILLDKATGEIVSGPCPLSDLASALLYEGINKKFVRKKAKLVKVTEVPVTDLTDLMKQFKKNAYHSIQEAFTD